MNKAQTDMLIAMWRECYEDLKLTEQDSVWVKIKVETDKLGKEKSIKIDQIKDKLRHGKDLYKQAKDTNKKMGRSPAFSPYYQDFDKILGTRDVISLQHSRKVGVTKGILNTEIDNEDHGGNIPMFFHYFVCLLKKSFLSVATFVSFPGFIIKKAF